MSERFRPAWRRSSRSTDGENCVEVAGMPAEIAVRDSKDPGGPRLLVPRRAWRTLHEDIRAGAYDLD
ncbi:DUF397 domain-containing protein [Actinomadura hibisca]|uniref:DUF397 domain-containing protein n=1 Tax=Actinomadura hibisca TaxID=68565 RepID=UPI00082F2598|nr:DUF397 domain-containing protein [Actinomadura hibisca]